MRRWDQDARSRHLDLVLTLTRRAVDPRCSSQRVVARLDGRSMRLVGGVGRGSHSPKGNDGRQSRTGEAIKDIEYATSLKMLVLFETSAGFSLFNYKKDKVKEEDVTEFFKTPALANSVIKLQSFRKFTDTTDALAAATAVVEGKLCKELKKFLKANIVDKGIQQELAVADAKVTPTSSPVLMCGDARPWFTQGHSRTHVEISYPTDAWVPSTVGWQADHGEAGRAVCRQLVHRRAHAWHPITDRFPHHRYADLIECDMRSIPSSPVRWT